MATAKRIKANPPQMVYTAKLYPLIVLYMRFENHFPGVWEHLAGAREYGRTQNLQIVSVFCFQLVEEVQVGSKRAVFPKLDKSAARTKAEHYGRPRWLQ